MGKRRLFVDMDGVLVDFAGYMGETGLTAEKIKADGLHYMRMRPLPGAVEATQRLWTDGWCLFIATKSPTARPVAAMAKVEWVLQHLPWLQRRIIITPDKGLLGCRHDVLVDDRPHKANCAAFPGELVVFAGWPKTLDLLRDIGPEYSA